MQSGSFLSEHKLVGRRQAEFCPEQVKNIERSGEGQVFEAKKLPERLPTLNTVQTKHISEADDPKGDRVSNAMRLVSARPVYWLESGSYGGRYWTRTSDPCDVNTVLYQLS